MPPPPAPRALTGPSSGPSPGPGPASAPLRHLTRAHLSGVSAHLGALWDAGGPMQLDLAETETIDGAGAMLLWRLHQRARAAGRPMQLLRVEPRIARTLQLFPARPTPAEGAPAPSAPLEQLGGWAEGALARTRAALSLAAQLVHHAGSAVRRRQAGPAGELAHQMLLMGVQAVGVVALIAFLVGVTVAMQSAAQLRQFGASLLTADLIGVAVTRELGPLMAAIVVAGRSGSAIAAELATMVITEELDALRVLGLDPVRFLLVPRLWALMLVQPMLTVVANSVAILGGLLVAVVYLDIAPRAFIVRLEEAVFLKDIATGLIKSVAFAGLIVLTGADAGLRTSGGPDAVGRSTTQAVVAAIFAIIVADAGFSLLFYFGD